MTLEEFVERRVFLYDTDSTGIVYHSRYLEWFEEVRLVLLEREYKPMLRMISEDHITFVPVECDLQFKRPTMFEDRVTIEVKVKAASKIAIDTKYTIIKEGKVAVTASMKLVCVSTKTGRPVKIPAPLMNILK